MFSYKTCSGNCVLEIGKIMAGEKPTLYPPVIVLYHGWDGRAMSNIHNISYTEAVLNGYKYCS